MSRVVNRSSIATRPCCPVNASGQAVAGDHAAALVNAGEDRADRPSGGRRTQGGRQRQTVKGGEGGKERADGANIGQLIT